MARAWRSLARITSVSSAATTRVREALARQPRVPLATLPTPLYDAVRFRDALGGPGRCPRILIKRDDLTALGLGGNKARKLEYLVADAKAQGATTLITTGAVQSNHARMTAAAACVAGMRCVLVLTSTQEVPAVAGNLLLDTLYGAEIRLVPSLDPMFAVGNDEPVVADVVQQEKVAGRVPYVIPVGGSSGVGVFGYIDGTAELVDQLEDARVSPSRLYYASGSRGTQAGLTLGAKLSQAPYRVYGVAVSGGETEKMARAKRIGNEAAARLDLPERIDDADLVTSQAQIGGGYGISTPDSLAAITLLARSEAILLDPCYTAKAMAGLIDDIRTGAIAPAETVVFLHTGGVPALFTQEFTAAAASGSGAGPT